MGWLDVVIIFAVFISVTLSFFRGLLKEALSVISWFLSIFVASLFHPSMALLLSGMVSSPSVRAPVAFAMLFGMTFALCQFLSIYLRGLVAEAGLTHLDRALGSVFGFVRGVLLVVLAVGLLRWFNLFVEEPWWREAMLIPYVEHLQDWADAITQSIGVRMAR